MNRIRIVVDAHDVPGAEPARSNLWPRGQVVDARRSHGPAIHPASVGFTPLHEASVRGEDAIVKLLVEYGADVNALGGRSRGTALHAAAAVGHASTAEILLESGADPLATDGVFDATPDQWAKIFGHADLADRLRRRRLLRHELSFHDRKRSGDEHVPQRKPTALFVALFILALPGAPSNIRAQQGLRSSQSFSGGLHTIKVVDALNLFPNVGALLYVAEPNDFGVPTWILATCTGTLIDERVLLVAGHCTLGYVTQPAARAVAVPIMFVCPPVP